MNWFVHKTSTTEWVTLGSTIATPHRDDISEAHKPWGHRAPVPSSPDSPLLSVRTCLLSLDEDDLPDDRQVEAAQSVHMLCTEGYPDTLSLYARTRRTVHFKQVGPLKDDASICWFESEELDRMPVFVGKWLKEDGQIRNSVQALTISLQRLGQPLQRHFICQNISSHACFLLDKPVLDRRSVQLHVTSMPLARTC
jgi:hypothetical protein